MRRTAILALLAGIVAGTAYAQSEPYSGPPGSRDPNDTYWRQPDDAYDRQPDYGYDREPDYGYDRDEAPAVDVGFFYDELSPYGEWVRHPRFGWAWFPRHVHAGWRPYSLGRWVGSDYGWTWVSDEPFGWATYHYGRWAWDSRVGWLWVPGTDWAPAWVSWQQGNGYVGWAPLPPAVGFEIGVGIRLGGFNLRLGIAPRDYAFVEERRFLDSRIGGYIVPEVRNVTIINNTTNITNYTVVNSRVINHGVPIEGIERATGRRAPRFRVATATNPRVAGFQRDLLSIYRPARSKLETVKVARRNNAGLPQAALRPNRSEARPPTVRPPMAPRRQETAEVPLAVAPRTKPGSRDNNEREFLREQKDLKASQDKEQRVLEQIHRQETARPQARANGREVAQRHAAELQEQKEQRRGAEQQLQTRQQIQRQAAKESATKPNKRSKHAGEAAKPKKDKKGDDGEERPRPF